MATLPEFDSRGNPSQAGSDRHTGPNSVSKFNRAVTKNGDLTNASTLDDFVSLFHILNEKTDSSCLTEHLERGWKANPASALKPIFHARSIHHGKGSRYTFYRAAACLLDIHPRILIGNPALICCPVIRKKESVSGGDDFEVIPVDKQDAEFELVQAEKQDDEASRFDVEHGVAHGYWKELLNMLVLKFVRELGPELDLEDLLNSEDPLREKLAIEKRRKGKRMGRRARGELYASVERSEKLGFSSGIHTAIGTTS